MYPWRKALTLLQLNVSEITLDLWFHLRFKLRSKFTTAVYSAVLSTQTKESLNVWGTVFLQTAEALNKESKKLSVTR